MSTEQVWLVTGACSGFGLLMTSLVLSKGHKCVATSIDPPALKELESKYGPSKLLNLHLDVTQPEQIKAAFAKAKAVFGRVDVVFNNAGLLLRSVAETTPEPAARKMFDVNFWGCVNVTNEAVRFFRDVNGPERGGKVLVVSSSSGIAAGPLFGYYSASKQAVEALTVSMSKELKPEWNIQLCILEPGWFTTPIMQPNPASHLPVPAAYVGGPASVADQAILHPGKPETAIELIYEVVSKEGRLPMHLPIGRGAIGIARRVADEWKKTADEWEEVSKGEEFGR